MRGLTKRQFELLQHLKKGGPDGLLDFDQLLDLLSWIPSKESAQFTIRAMVRKGLILKGERLQLRRGRYRVCYQLTQAGEQVLDPRWESNAREHRFREELAIPGLSKKLAILDSSGSFQGG